MEAWLRYGNDLGLGPYYRDRAVLQQDVAASEGLSAKSVDQAAQTVAAAVGQAGAVSSVRVSPTSVPPVAGAPLSSSSVISSAAGPSLFEASDRIEGDTFQLIRETIGDCTRCKLHKGRTNIVFGVGSLKAQLVFVGEGPGRDEDIKGEPFVGRAGKLLTQMIEAMGLRREDVYICNVVKCRPPENRLPEKDEITTCSPFLFRQIDVIRPKVICCLGSCASQTLLQTTQGISRFRGEWFDFRGSKLIATYHPAYLLRNPNAKGEVWKDLQKVMAVLGLQPKRK
ncbi:MAG TPA: uracil-DNA glycosylase [Candidatus Acidoferrales bacterium]|nr:uracil-DNA glycosylase [Candidatus Acidoferrales bacterium]